MNERMSLGDGTKSYLNDQGKQLIIGAGAVVWLTPCSQWESCSYGALHIAGRNFGSRDAEASSPREMNNASQTDFVCRITFPRPSAEQSPRHIVSLVRKWKTFMIFCCSSECHLRSWGAVHRHKSQCDVAYRHRASHSRQFIIHWQLTIWIASFFFHSIVRPRTHVILLSM